MKMKGTAETRKLPAEDEGHNMVSHKDVPYNTYIIHYSQRICLIYINSRIDPPIYYNI